MSMNRFKAVLLASVLFSSLNAVAAPISLVWVNTPVVRTVSWFNESANGGRGATVSEQISTAGVAGTITLPDDSIFQNGSAVFALRSDPSGTMPVNASGSLSGWPIPAGIQALTIGIPAITSLDLNLASGLCSFIECTLTGSLSRDPANASHYFGSVALSQRPVGNRTVLTLEATSQTVGRFTDFPVSFNGIGNAFEVPVVGYWQVVGNNNVPIPGSLALCLIGSLMAAFVGKKKAG
jgi:hypothetical protein